MRNRLQHRIYEFEIALGTGARKSEQYGLCWSDVDLKHKTVTFRGTKNGDTRMIPMIQSVYSAFKQLDKMRLKGKDRREGEPNPAPSDAVFGIGGNKKSGGKRRLRRRVSTTSDGTIYVIPSVVAYPSATRT